MSQRFSSADLFYFIVANAVLLGIAAFAFLLESGDPDFYYFTVQEDEYLEWASFWAFLLAAAAFVRGAQVIRGAATAFPWFLYGVALFCFVVAMEEISWGQRLLGYRPPVYFLEHNYQQELNIHNVIETDYRKLALMLVIAGYGIVLPVLARLPVAKDWLARVGVVVPPVALLPSFGAALVLYLWYPISYSGEWVEMILGLGFLFSAVPMTFGHSGRLGAVSLTAIASVAVFGLGALSAAVTRAQRDADPANMEAARIEVAAIADDFNNGLAMSDCNLHKRLYTFVIEYDQYDLLEGRYAGLQAQGLPPERAEFFLDPWNSPYWIRDRCNRRAGTRTTFVYSFGPNRRRDSTRTEILGDDIGAHFSPGVDAARD